MKKNRKNMTEGKISSTLFRLTLPMIVGIAGMAAFNLVDTFFVGQLGTRELAAMSFTFPVIMVIASIAMGLGVATSSIISRAIGEDDHRQVQRLTTDALILSFLVVLVFSLAGLFTIDPLFRLLGADNSVLPLINDYMLIWYIGMPFVIIPMVGNNAIRATGDTMTPTLVMLISIAVNIIMDPILIFGFGFIPAMGLKGAALATITARSVTLIFALLILSQKLSMITGKAPSLKEAANSWKRLLYIGIPSAATNLIFPLSMGIITRMVAQFGQPAVAAFGVAIRIEFFIMAPVAALSSVLMPFTGQNYGAGKFDRIAEAMKKGSIFTLTWGFFIFCAMVLFSNNLTSLFDANPEVSGIAAQYLVIVALFIGFMGLSKIVSAALNALDRPFKSAEISILQLVIIYIPLAWHFSGIYGLKGIFYSASISYFLTGLLSIFLFAKEINNHKKICKTDLPEKNAEAVAASQ